MSETEAISAAIAKSRVAGVCTVYESVQRDGNSLGFFLWPYPAELREAVQSGMKGTKAVPVATYKRGEKQ